ncbi:type II toxin-antitoxin system VapB family antitoxin [Sphaerotilus mobilis]|uniref:VapB protein of antitoxin of type II toxin-antitoxin system n=1 Tax=Sphaerotilus mobilis TaxID=47994 RepID=A0A4V2EX15_9BURK|nr:type II toxin-antitoxin system VapB family antitoxin [Sphaerotilus mobilis]RZS57910.1 VapB protein of antitoxin of type II toxin-antitoxin system [Sphaerotilus mobilis]
MRTNIVIDPDLLDAAMKAGPYKTKKEAVEAGLRLLARQASYREILKWKGKLKWEGDEDIDWTQPRVEDEVTPAERPETVEEPAGRYQVKAEAKTRTKAGSRARR